jgi:hypothetical protein
VRQVFRGVHRIGPLARVASELRRPEQLHGFAEIPIGVIEITL